MRSQAEARRFLETLAICGRPMAPDLICDACGVARERQSLVAMLRSSHFIRSSGSSERVETYHDRIREVLAAQIPPDAVRRIHGSWCKRSSPGEATTARRCSSTIEAPAIRRNAAIQAGLAAAKASTALAFDRAAFFYRQALALSRRRRAAGVEGRFADALANAGRPAEAAEAYLDATAGAGHAQRVELQRRAAEQFLIGGHIDRGPGPDSQRARGRWASVRHAACARAMFSLLWRRAQLRWRGLRFVSRPVDRHRPRCTAPRGHLLVGGDGTGIGGRDRRLGVQRTSSAHGARRRRTVSHRPRDGDRVGSPEARIRQAGQLSERLIEQSTDTGEERGTTRTRSPCPSWPRHQCDQRRRMETGVGVLGAGADDAARSVRRESRGK